ncbi:septation protein A [Inquilinus sp. CAU 1745]|uniref:septation protein A n=1 Tax=Inquilinus sp. CAU 1745 TaxID=3140369 RepID=UPI00325B936E
MSSTDRSEAKTRSPLLRMALEAGPLVAFFIVNRMEGIMTGTAVFMVATLVSVALSYWLERRVPLMPLIGCGFVMVFGGLTLWLDDAIFIKIKPTVVNLLFAGILFGGLAFGRVFLKLLMGTVLNLTDEGWRLLTWRWAFFFIFLAILNEIVWRSLPTDAWVNFKVFGIMPLSIAFGAAQIPLIMKHTIEEENEAT